MIKSEIKLLIKQILKERDVFQSWGGTNLVVEYDKIEFEVNAFKYKGRVIVICNDFCNYEITIGDYVTKRLCTSEVVPFIDNQIEAGDNYLKRLGEYVQKKSSR